MQSPAGPVPNNARSMTHVCDRCGHSVGRNRHRPPPRSSVSPGGPSEEVAGNWHTLGKSAQLASHGEKNARLQRAPLRPYANPKPIRQETRAR